MEPNSNAADNASSKNKEDGKGKIRVAEKITRFLRWRPTMTDLQDRNIIKGSIDTTKSTLERNQTKKKLANLFVPYDVETTKKQTTHPQFGIDPTSLAEMYPDQPFGIPRILSTCFAYIEKNLHFEGLFRVTGSHIQITTLRISVENGSFEVISKCTTPQTITGMVSLFFRQLPQPLIPWELFPECMAIGGITNEQEKIDALRKLMQDRLPAANYRIMIAFMRLLKKIAQNSAANMMTASNLGLVWGPTLLQDRDPMSSMVGDNLTRSNLLVELMIAQYDTIFPHDPKQFPTSPPNSPPPQRPPPPTIAPTSPIIPRQIPSRALSQSSESIQAIPPFSSSSPPVALRLGSSGTVPTSPSAIVTPSRPPMANRGRPYTVAGSPESSSSSSVPEPPPMPPSQRTTPPHVSTPSYPPRRASPKPPPIVPPAPSTSSPAVSPVSPASSSPSISFAPLPPSTNVAPLSPMGRPPRPPRFNTVSNFNATSPETSPTRARGRTEGSQVFERYDSSPQLTGSGSDEFSDTDASSGTKAELSSSPTTIKYTTRTIGTMKISPKLGQASAPLSTSPKTTVGIKPARPPKPLPAAERFRSDSYA